MDELQVYDDLIQLDISKYKERIDELEGHINKLNADIQTLCTKMLDMKKSQESLVTNISALYSTAKNEIQRKDRMIAQLRREKDEILLRKGNFSYNKRLRSRSRSKSKENKKGRYNIGTDGPAEGTSKEKAGNLLAKISEDKCKSIEVVVKNEPNKDKFNPRSSREKEQENKTKENRTSPRMKHKEKAHFKPTDNKNNSKRLKMDEYNASRSNNDAEKSKTLIKNPYAKENSKNPRSNHPISGRINPSNSHHRRENDNSSTKLSNDKNRARDAKQSADIRNKLISRSKYSVEDSKRHKTDFLMERSDKDSSKSIKERDRSVQNEIRVVQNKIIIVSPSNKGLIKVDDEVEDGEINDDSIIIDLSLDVKESENKFAEVLKTDLLKLAGSSDLDIALANKKGRDINGKLLENEASNELIHSDESNREITTNPTNVTFVLKPSQFMNDIITDAEMSGDNIAETKINEDNIVELHIHKKSDESDNAVNCTAPESNVKEYLTQIEENSTLGALKPLENDISSNNSGIQVYQNNENVNTSNNRDLVQTEEKINVTATPTNISSCSSRRRRRAIVFIS